MNAKTVKDPEWDPNGNTHPIQITDDEIYWSAGGGKRIYTRSASQLTIYEGDTVTDSEPPTNTDRPCKKVRRVS